MPPEDNAYTYLRRAEADIKDICKQTDNVQSASECPGYIISPEDQKTIKTAFAAYPNVLPLVERAAACKDYNPDWDYALGPQELLQRILDEAGRFRGAARMLRRKAMLLVAEGKRDEAVRTCLLIFGLARHLDHNALVVEYLVAGALRGMAIETANEALQTGPVSKGVRDALDAELAVEERMDGFPATLRCERTYCVSSADEMPMRHFWFLSRGLWNIQESACLELFPACIALASDPRPYCQIEQTLDVKGNTPVLASLLLPSLKADYESVTRVKAQIRSLRVLNALQSYAAAGSDAAPKLTDLGLPVETTTDPFNGEPLHVKKTPQGWLVYSVGENLRDDGGKLDDPHQGDVGVGPPKARGRP
jgi:hypothetical protein